MEQGPHCDRFHGFFVGYLLRAGLANDGFRLLAATFAGAIAVAATGRTAAVVTTLVTIGRTEEAHVQHLA